MYENCKGKKLLVIGVEENESIIRAAQSMGVYVVLVDKNADKFNSLAKNLANEVWKMDYSDVDAVAEKCRENNISGVMAGYSEFKVSAAQKISEKLGTNFYATAEQIAITRNKRSFKDLCAKCGIPTPIDYCFSEKPSQEELSKIKYPVIIKPTDYAGSKGISVCNKEEQLFSAFDYALEYSVSKTIICEQYLKGTEIAAIYTIVNGEASLSCLNDKFLSKTTDDFAGRCAAVLTPSKHYQEYMDNIDGKIKVLLKTISAKNGVAFFQGIATEEGIYIFEMGYRLNGNNDCTIIEKYNNINFMKMLISYSLTGQMGDDISKDNPQFKEFLCSVCFRLHCGVVGSIDYKGVFEDPCVLDAHCYVSEGTKIENENNAQSRGAVVKIGAPTLEELAKKIKWVQSKVIINDVNGKSLLFDGFNPDILIER